MTLYLGSHTSESEKEPLQADEAFISTQSSWLNDPKVDWISVLTHSPARCDSHGTPAPSLPP